MKHRVLFTASTFSHIVNFHRPYLQAFRDLGWEVVVACGGREMDIPEADRRVVIPFEKSITSPKNANAVLHLRRLLRTDRYDIISCHTALAAFFTRLAVFGMKNRPAVACTAHGYLFDADTRGLRGKLLRGAERITAPVTDVLMTMNRWDSEYALAHRLGKTIVEIPGMGVNFPAMRPVSQTQAQQLRESLGLASDDILLIYAAEFSARKSQMVLLEALRSLPERVKLLLPGDGALREACMDFCRDNGLSHRVRFPGQVHDMPLWYAAADVAVSSSRSEGLPFNIMEAMYFGLPIVASEVKGHTDLLRPGETGLLYPYGDAEACAAQLRRLLEEPELAGTLGRQAAQAVQAYALPEVFPIVMAVYQNYLLLADEKAPSGTPV